MTRAERRVAIAKDVIKAVNAKRFGEVASETGYVRKLEYGAVPEIIDQKVASELMPLCTVCARGAMMLCRISKYNGVKIRSYFGINDRDTSRALKDAFSDNQLEVIERAFESTPGYSVHNSADRFGQCFANDEDRLVAIMQNIIDHKGTFRPEVLYEMK